MFYSLCAHSYDSEGIYICFPYSVRLPVYVRGISFFVLKSFFRIYVTSKVIHFYSGVEKNDNDYKNINASNYQLSFIADIECSYRFTWKPTINCWKTKHLQY